MAERHKVSIGDNDFFIRRYDPFLALEILGDLQKQFAGPMLSMIDGKAGGSEEQNQAALMAAFAKLSATMDGKTLRALAERLLNPEYVSVSIGGAEPRKLDASAVMMSLSGAGDIIRLCWAVVSHNYSEVLARLASPTGPAGGLWNRSLSANSGKNSSGN